MPYPKRTNSYIENGVFNEEAFRADCKAYLESSPTFGMQASPPCTVDLMNLTGGPTQKTCTGETLLRDSAENRLSYEKSKYAKRSDSSLIQELVLLKAQLAERDDQITRLVDQHAVTLESLGKEKASLNQTFKSTSAAAPARVAMRRIGAMPAR